MINIRWGNDSWTRQVKKNMCKTTVVENFFKKKCLKTILFIAFEYSIPNRLYIEIYLEMFLMNISVILLCVVNGSVFASQVCPNIQTFKNFEPEKVKRIQVLLTVLYLKL